MHNLNDDGERVSSTSNPVVNSIIGGENDLEELLRDVANVDFVVAHNAKFELGWLKRCGLDLRKILVYDTMLAEWVLLGNNRDTGLSLEASSKRRGLGMDKDVVGSWIRSGVDPQNIPIEWLVDYCLKDISLTAELFKKQVVLLEQRNQLHLVYQRGLVCACLADIEFNGLKLDRSRVYEEYDKILKEYNEVQVRLNTIAEGVNWESPKQVGNLLYNALGFDEPRDRRGEPIRTATGQPSASKAVLELLKPKNKKQKEFLELYRLSAKLNARLTKSLQFFKGVCDEYDGVFYGAFNQGHTATHRLSSSGRKLSFSNGDNLGVQLQNLLREYKKLFRAKREGWLIGEVDGAQAEFRVAADLGHDKVAFEEIATGVDVHGITAKFYVENGTQEEFKGLTLEQARQPAKGHTFKPLFAGRGNTPAEQEYCKFFQNKYQGIYATQRSWANRVVASKDGELISPYGMRFYWPGTRLRRDGSTTNDTSIFNYCIQGFATAEIIPIALVFFWHRINGLDIELINTIHDSVVVELHPSCIEELHEIAVQSFTRDVYKFLKEVYDYQFEVPLGAEIKISEYWSEGKGYKENVFPEEVLRYG